MNLGEVVESIDPANGEVVDTFEIFSPAQVDAALETAHNAFVGWRRIPWERPAELMSAVAAAKPSPAPSIPIPLGMITAGLALTAF